MYNPPFEALETKNLLELEKIIAKIKRKIARLKRKMEDPRYDEQKKLCPIDDVVLKCDSDFLRAAILHYIGLGGKYEPNRREKSDIKFNSNLKGISKIVFTFRYYLGLKTTVVVDLTGENLTISHSDFDKSERLDCEFSKEDFLSELEKLHVGAWRNLYTPKRYGLCVLDGYEWEIKIKYRNSKSKKFAGVNAKPYNFKEFLSLIGEEGVSFY